METYKVLSPSMETNDGSQQTTALVDSFEDHTQTNKTPFGNGAIPPQVVLIYDRSVVRLWIANNLRRQWRTIERLVVGTLDTTRKRSLYKVGDNVKLCINTLPKTSSTILK